MHLRVPSPTVVPHPHRPSRLQMELVGGILVFLVCFGALMVLELGGLPMVIVLLAGAAGFMLCLSALTSIKPENSDN